MFGMERHVRGLVYRSGCRCDRCRAVHHAYRQRPAAERERLGPPRQFVSDRIDVVAEVLHGRFAT